MTGILLLATAPIALGVLYLVFQCIYNAFFHALRFYPGPRSYAISPIRYALASISGNIPFILLKLHEQYGEVVRIGPNVLSYTNPDAWKDIYGHAKGDRPSLAKDPIFYDDPTSTEVDDIIVANGLDHSRFRRLLSHAFSEKALRDQEPLMKKYVDLLITRLSDQVRAGKSVNMVEWYNFTTFDLIGDLAMGESFHSLESSDYHPWVKMIFDGVKYFQYLSAVKRFPMILNLLIPLIPKSLGEKKLEHVAMTKEKVNQRLEQKTARPDFMSYILRHNDEKGMTVEEIQANARVLIIAGSETTATLLSGATYYIGRDPQVMQKLVDEIRGTFRHAEDITLAGVSGLTYMLAVLDESLRIYPPVPADLPRLVPAEGCMIAGQWVPGGTSVFINQWTINHSPHNFLNPYSFHPERWLGDARFESDRKDAAQAFSIGPRNCIGRNLAYAEMRLILATVLWHFDLELVQDDKDWLRQEAMTLWDKPPLMARLTPVVRT